MSNLPFLNVARHVVTLPDSQKKVQLRPYLAGEEKGLLLAIESGDPKVMQEAIRNLINSCIVSDDVKVPDLTFVDLEFIFIQLRIMSVAPQAELQFAHKDTTECKEVTTVNVDLNKFEYIPGASKKIILDEQSGVGVVMRPPTVGILEGLSSKTGVAQSFEMIVACIDSAFDRESVYTGFTRDELKAWVDQLTEKQLQKLLSFFDNKSRLLYKIHWNCEHCGQNESREVEGILNFL